MCHHTSPEVSGNCGQAAQYHILSLYVGGVLFDPALDWSQNKEVSISYMDLLPLKVNIEVHVVLKPFLSSCCLSFIYNGLGIIFSCVGVTITALGLTQPLTEMSTRNLRGDKGQLAHKTDNLTAICKPNV
jgi:hypothetical protein